VAGRPRAGPGIDRQVSGLQPIAAPRALS